MPASPVVVALALAIIMTGCSAPAHSASAHSARPPQSPYETLRRAYAARDAGMAASAYSPGARLTYAGEPGGRDDSYRGTAEIQQSFQAFFDRLRADHRGDSVDLNFRVTARRGAEESGVYRLRVGRTVAAYGRFDVTRADGRFLTDVSRPATRADFEDTSGPVLLDAGDEELDPAYYGALTGRYVRPDGCALVFTSSPVRLFVRNACTGAWRGLTRVSGRVWTAGDRVLSDRADATYRFAPADTTGSSPSLTTEGAEEPFAVASRATPYRTQAVTFAAPDGAVLAGDLYRPTGRPGLRPATVLVHGSGPQDRRGYASVIQVFADALAAEGHVVLAYDKRGAGLSGGRPGDASFAVLGGDARAALAYLRGLPGVDPNRVSFAGSSQAGWVVARAIADGANPASVFLLGAAGTALTVPEQNLYNTRVRMACAGVSAPDVALALDQQQAFFAFLADPAQASTLDRITAEAQRRPALADWLFPASADVDRSGGDWFTTLELEFDPLPVWAAYDRPAVFVFAEHDDATPTEVAVGRLGRLANPQLTVHVLDGAQHLGLRARDACHADLADSEAFHPGLFEALAAFAARAGRRP